MEKLNLVKQFERDGCTVFPGFCSIEECSKMKNRMKELVGSLF